MARLILLNKPYNALSQFTDSVGRATLASYVDIAGVYPAVRLDLDSEGLLLLTDDGALQHHVTDPRHRLPKIYWVQVEGVPDNAALARLRAGVVIQRQQTLPANVRRLTNPAIWPRDPPIRYRKALPTAWLALTLHEGRNRQVRHMTAAVGHPTLRLIRYAVGPWSLDGLAPGAWREVDARFC